MVNSKMATDDITYKKLLHAILRIRLVEEEIAKRYPQGKMRCPTHLSIGQEAIPVVICNFLHHDDLAVSSHRAHAHYLAKGGSLPKLIAELYGKKSGCTEGRGGSMNLSDLQAGFVASKAIVGNTIPVGVGLALAQKLKNTSTLTCIFFGDAAVEEGAFYESLNYAVLKKLPALFVCENNLYSVNSHLDLRQPKERSIVSLAEGIGVKARQFDGNDIFAYFNSLQSIVEDLRNQDGPWFVEFTTYRYKVHCGHEDDLDERHRPKNELNYWLGRDPIVLLENRLLEAGVITSQEVIHYRQQLHEEIEQAFQFAQEAVFPEASERFLYQYAPSNLAWLRNVLSEKEGVDVGA